MAALPSSARAGTRGPAGRPARAVVALGSNRPHGRHGPPRRVLAAAVAALAAGGLEVEAVARVRETRPLGPGSRRYANGAVLGLWHATPPALMALCRATERAFGRRPGRRWGDRVLDCDLLLVDGERRSGGGLELPHPRLALRRFVLDPLVELWPGWRHPRLRLTARQLAARLAKPRPARLQPGPWPGGS